MEVYKYTIREAFPKVTEQKHSETKLKLSKLTIYKAKSKKQEKRDGVH